MSTQPNLAGSGTVFVSTSIQRFRRWSVGDGCRRCPACKDRNAESHGDSPEPGAALPCN